MQAVSCAKKGDETNFVNWSSQIKTINDRKPAKAPSKSYPRVHWLTRREIHFLWFPNIHCKQVLLHRKKYQLVGIILLIKTCTRLNRSKILFLKVNRLDIDTVAVGIMKVRSGLDRQTFGTVSAISTRHDWNVSVHFQKLCKIYICMYPDSLLTHKSAESRFNSESGSKNSQSHCLNYYKPGSLPAVDQNCATNHHLRDRFNLITASKQHCVRIDASLWGGQVVEVDLWVFNWFWQRWPVVDA